MRIKDQEITTLLVTNTVNQILFAISDENMFGANTVKVFVEHKPGEINLFRTPDGIVTVLEENSLMSTSDIFTQPETEDSDTIPGNVSQGDFVTIDGAGNVIDLMTTNKNEDIDVTPQEETAATSKDISKQDITIDKEQETENITITDELLKQVPPETVQKFLADFLEHTKQQKEAEENKKQDNNKE